MSEDVDVARVLGRMREIDRRKHAAAKPAKDAQIKRRRELGNARAKKHYHAHKNDVQTVNHAKAKCESLNPLTAAQKTKQYQQLFDEPSQVKPNPIREDLMRLSHDRKAPASARVTALRTLAEMDGHIGKLQTQSNETADRSLGTMTRAQLEAELARLRAIVAGRGT